MKIRPLFILADLEAGGAQRVILTVLRHLDRAKFEPHLAIINKNGPLFKEIPKHVYIHDLKVGRVRYALLKILKLCRLIRPDLLVSTLGHLNLLVLILRFLLPRHIRLIIREANTPSIRLRYSSHPFLYRLCYRLLYPFADKVICNSYYMKKDMVSHFSLNPDKISVIPNPVDLERINQNILDNPNPYKSGRYQLVAVGRLNYQKGFDLLLKAFQRSFEELAVLHLTIVGEGSEREVLQRSSKSLGISGFVSFVGHQDNPFPYMAYADLFVSSSRWEGLPNVVLESLACRTPVLAFDCPGGTREIIREGKNGWLVPSGDWEAMAEKIVEVVEFKERLKLSEDQFFPKEYSSQYIVKRFEKLLIKSFDDFI